MGSTLSTSSTCIISIEELLSGCEDDEELPKQFPTAEHEDEYLEALPLPAPRSRFEVSAVEAAVEQGVAEDVEQLAEDVVEPLPSSRLLRHAMGQPEALKLHFIN